MTRLRCKMLEDMQLRNLSPATAEAYVRCVASFARYFNLAPDRLATEHVRAFLLHLATLGRAPATRVVYHAALTFLYGHTLDQADVMASVPRPKVTGQKPGRSLTRPEAKALLDALASRPFDYTFFALMLATGLRISEATALTVHDIDRRAGLLHVRHGKGDKARSVMLSPRTLRLLERYWVVIRPCGPHLFPAQRLRAPGCVDLRNRWADHPVSIDTMSDRLRAIQPADRPRVVSHDLRRTFATWLMENGTDLRLVQVLLGHASPQTTARYTLVKPDLIARTASPFDTL